jgi:hypothetical protein
MLMVCLDSTLEKNTFFNKLTYQISNSCTNIAAHAVAQRRPTHFGRQFCPASVLRGAKTTNR